MPQQLVHHLCLKLKHASLARHPRVSIRDHPLYRRIADILLKEGFLVTVMPGDVRGPFVDALAALQVRSMPVASMLTQGQRERLEVQRRMRQALETLHKAVGSDGSTVVRLDEGAKSGSGSGSGSGEAIADVDVNGSTNGKQSANSTVSGVTKQQLKQYAHTLDTLFIKECQGGGAAMETYVRERITAVNATIAGNAILPPTSSSSSSSTASTMTLSQLRHRHRHPVQYETQSLYLPPLSAIPVPALDDPALDARDVRPSDLYTVTPRKERRLWMDLRYDQHERPALSDMFVVSKGSRMVSTDPQQIAAVLSGDVQAGNNPWSTRASCVGAVAIVQSTSGDVMTAFEAMKRGVGGEVLCAVK